jgi:preprotein translocase subunit SecG
MIEFLLKFFLIASAIIVIILVMLQKGKGGGLAGALGGMGGQSAFGTKAGDLFTKITVGVASFWIVISIFAAIYAPHLSGGGFNLTPSANAQQSPGPETPAPGTSTENGAGKTESGAGKADKSGKAELPAAAEKGAKGSEPAGKLPEKPAK